MKIGAAWMIVGVIAMAGSSTAQPPLALPAPVVSNVMNAPNPFDSRQAGAYGQTQIFYTLASDSDIQIKLFDLLGHRVREWSFTAGSEGAKEGDNRLLWDGTNEAGQKVSKGGYLARIEVRSAQGYASVIRKIGVIH